MEPLTELSQEGAGGGEPPGGGPLWTAVFEYEACGEDELSLRPGDVVQVLSRDSHVSGDEGWWTGKIDQRVGIFPSNYVSSGVQGAGPELRARYPPPPAIQRKAARAPGRGGVEGGARRGGPSPPPGAGGAGAGGEARSRSPPSCGPGRARTGGSRDREKGVGGPPGRPAEVPEGRRDRRRPGGRPGPAFPSAVTGAGTAAAGGGSARGGGEGGAGSGPRGGPRRGAEGAAAARPLAPCGCPGPAAPLGWARPAPAPSSGPCSWPPAAAFLLLQCPSVFQASAPLRGGRT